MTEFEPHDGWIAPGELESTRTDLEYFEGFARYLGAEEFIESIRQPPIGPLDIEATAEKLDLPVSLDSDTVGHASITGLDNDKPIEIHVNRYDYEKAMSFAHEVGHYLLFLEDHHGKYNMHIEEGFCEFFGRMLSMPDLDDIDIDSVTPDLYDKICRDYQVSPHSFTIWLMERRVIPDQVIIDTRIPVKPNPLYSKKVSRHIVCLNCEYGICSSESYKPEDELPIIDLTSLELGDGFRVGHEPLTRPGEDYFNMLQELYGNK